MYFPVAGIEVSPWLPPLVAFTISFFTSMGGVSGAFLLLPFQVSVLNFHSPAVSATNHLFNIVAIPSGVYRYIREGRMVWSLAWSIIIGTLPGVFIGILIRIRYLPDPASFKRFAALVLFYIGMRLIRDMLIRSPLPAGKISGNLPLGSEMVTDQHFSLRSITFIFQKNEYRVSTMPVLGMSLAVGLIGGIYGIGGGAIIPPFLSPFSACRSTQLPEPP